MIRNAVGKGPGINTVRRTLTRKQTRQNDWARGRKGDTQGIFKDTSLLSGPMYRSQNMNTKLGV